MSLDGTFLHCVVSEMLSAGLVGGRIDKIYQPSREEILFQYAVQESTIRY